MFLYAQIYWLAEFGDVSCLQFYYLSVETLILTLTATREDFVGHIVGRICWTFCRTILRVILSSSPTKLCVRPESMIVDTLGRICTLPATSALSEKNLTEKAANRFNLIQKYPSPPKIAWSCL